MTTVSCGNGKLAADGTPPDVSAHAVADQLPPAARLQYLVTPASNVIPLLPPQSPSRVPDHGADAPDTAMSLKSTSDSAATLATVNVRVVPGIDDLTTALIAGFAEVPKVSVPVTTVSPLNVTKVSRTAAELEKVRLLNVLDPLIALDTPAVDVNDTLLNVLLPPLKFTLGLGKIILDVPASSVIDAFKRNPFAVNVLLPRLTTREVETVLHMKDVIVTLKLFVENEPFSIVMFPVEVCAEPRPQAPPTPSRVMLAAIDTLLVVIVLPVVVELKVMRPVALQTVRNIGYVLRRSA